MENAAFALKNRENPAFAPKSIFHNIFKSIQYLTFFFEFVHYCLKIENDEMI